jgi:DNA-binding NtrC family response regulator
MTEKKKTSVAILLVEDEESHRADWVEKINIRFPAEVEVREAASFDGVADIWDSGFRPDIAVIDHRLQSSERCSSSTGDYVAEWLKTRCPGIRMLVITGASMESLDGGRVYEAYRRLEPDILFYEKDGDWATVVFPELEKMINEVRGVLPEVVKALQSALTVVSPAMQGFVRTIAPYVRKRCPLLLLGNPGVGKTFIAQAIHQASVSAKDSETEFFPVPCTALAESLLEAELFGSAKGSFTGATSDRKGYFEAADGGTIFLDEIGDISMGFQSKLLEVIQTGMYRRVGETKERKTNARVIAATNADLRSKVSAVPPTFRQDLYDRLSGAEFQVPSLCERPDDIVPLAMRYLNERYPDYSLARASKDLLIGHDWPGNVRELVNELEAAVAASGSRQLGPHLFLRRNSRDSGASAPTAPAKTVLATADTVSERNWRTGIDMEYARALANQIWKTRGLCIKNDPNDILDKHGVPYLRAVLALLMGALERQDFDAVLGFKPSRGLSQYFQNLSAKKDGKFTEYFRPRPGRKQFGANDVKEDAELLKEAGFRLDLE